jgi:3-dehydroquinate synthase
MKVIESDNYQILIGEKSLTAFGFSDYSAVAILVDENTKKHCLPFLLGANLQLNNALIIEINSGEENKNIATCNYIWQQLTSNNFDRNALLINLGGGVIGDMGGFCASTYKRGIDFVQIPTTLLAMVDASVGGKLGIDFDGLKNQVGLFANPKIVIINPEFLKTLDKNQLVFGFAEVVKHALIADKEFWNTILETPFDKLNWNYIIKKSVQIKNNIVLNDPREKGERKKLNFGHTFGHAIESYYLQKGTPVFHGQAIALGILLESKMSDLTEIEKGEITEFILSNFTLPYNPAKNKLIQFLLNDKKNKAGKINFSLLEGIGSCSIDNLFSANEL